MLTGKHGIVFGVHALLQTWFCISGPIFMLESVREAKSCQSDTMRFEEVGLRPFSMRALN
jgi:hypothetical protein